MRESKMDMPHNSSQSNVTTIPWPFNWKGSRMTWHIQQKMLLSLFVTKLLTLFMTCDNIYIGNLKKHLITMFALEKFAPIGAWWVFPLTNLYQSVAVGKLFSIAQFFWCANSFNQKSQFAKFCRSRYGFGSQRPTIVNYDSRVVPD